MQALQLKLLVAFAVIVTMAVGLAASAIPAQADTAPVRVAVVVRRSVALTVAKPVGETNCGLAIASNVECYAEPTTIVRDGTAVTALTVVPSR